MLPVPVPAPVPATPPPLPKAPPRSFSLALPTQSAINNNNNNNNNNNPAHSSIDPALIAHTNSSRVKFSATPKRGEISASLFVGAPPSRPPRPSISGQEIEQIVASASASPDVINLSSPGRARSDARMRSLFHSRPQPPSGHRRSNSNPGKLAEMQGNIKEEEEDQQDTRQSPVAKGPVKSVQALAAAFQHSSSPRSQSKQPVQVATSLASRINKFQESVAASGKVAADVKASSKPPSASASPTFSAMPPPPPPPSAALSHGDNAHTQQQQHMITPAPPPPQPSAAAPSATPLTSFHSHTHSTVYPPPLPKYQPIRSDRTPPPPFPTAVAVHVASRSHDPNENASASPDPSESPRSTKSTPEIPRRPTVAVAFHSSSASTSPTPGRISVVHRTPQPSCSLTPAQQDAIEAEAARALASRDFDAMRSLLSRCKDAHFYPANSAQLAEIASALEIHDAHAFNSDLLDVKRLLRDGIAAKHKDQLKAAIERAEVMENRILTQPFARKTIRIRAASNLFQQDDGLQTVNGPARGQANPLMAQIEFFQLVDDAKRLLNSLEQETIDIIIYYIKQGMSSKNRVLLRQAIEKANYVINKDKDAAHASPASPANSLAPLHQTLAQANAMLNELDVHHLMKFYLTTAIQQQDPQILDVAIHQARKIGMVDADHSELQMASKMLDDLKSHAAPVPVPQTIGATASKPQASEKAKAKSTGSKFSDFFSSFSRGLFSKKEAAAEPKSGGLVFGRSLAEAVRGSAYEVPVFVHDCIEFLRANGGLVEPGLFRLAGNHSSIEQIKRQLESGVQLDFIPFEVELHDISNLLKQYFRYLPEPLIPHSMYGKFMELGNLKGAAAHKIVPQLQALVEQLPSENRTVAAYLVRFLVEVTDNAEINKMTAENLAICFAPNLFKPKEENPQSLILDMPISISIFAAFINFSDEIFGLDPATSLDRFSF